MSWSDYVVESDPRQYMWEILVPTQKRVAEDFGNPYYTTRFHRTWDAKVRAITGGLTIMPPVKGEWMSDDDELYRERMIPVRIMATRAGMDTIVDMTIAHYDQLAVMFYKVSDEVMIRNRK